MRTARETLSQIAQRLADVTETPQFEAELLLCHVTGWNRARLIARLDDPVDTSVLEPLVARREQAEPIAYILGTWEFYGLELAVEAPLLVPRPETEHLVEIGLTHLPKAGARALDLCTGTGCVALALGHESGAETLWATDINPVAIRVATENFRRHDLPVHVGQGDLFAALPTAVEPFHVILSNPPYVEAGTWEGLAPDIRNYEDPGALLSGDDGLDCLRQIITQAPMRLVHGGLLALEMGETQGATVCALLEARGFVDVAITKDLAGLDRIAHGIWDASSTSSVL